MTHPCSRSNKRIDGLSCSCSRGLQHSELHSAPRKVDRKAHNKVLRNGWIDNKNNYHMPQAPHFNELSDVDSELRLSLKSMMRATGSDLLYHRSIGRRCVVASPTSAHQPTNRCDTDSRGSVSKLFDGCDADVMADDCNIATLTRCRGRSRS